MADKTKKSRTPRAKLNAESQSLKARFIIETEDTITIGRRKWDGQWRDRFTYQRDKFIQDVIKSFRTNPITRRLCEITTEFVVGDGFSFSTKQTRLEKFLNQFWNDPLNDLDTQLEEWADEAWRTGDLFILFSVDESGMSFVRAVPGELITDIETRNNDYRQEVSFKRNEIDEDPYPAYRPGEEQKHFVLHFPLNRMVGCVFGESDFNSILYWINLYQQWLEDRARTNYFRGLFSYIVQKNFSTPQEKAAFTEQIQGRLPQPGSVLVTDPTEHWGTLNPNLGSFEAGEDGLAIKRMPAMGAGTPMHYLAEPEASTSTTAEAAGTPTFKRFKRRQNFIKRVVKRVITVAVEVRRQKDSRLPPSPSFTINAPDISQRDNTNLALATQRIVDAIAPILNAGLVDEKEFIRLVYRFLDEQPPANIGKATEPVGQPTGKAAPGTTPQPGDETSTEDAAQSAPYHHNGAH